MPSPTERVLNLLTQHLRDHLFSYQNYITKSLNPKECDAIDVFPIQDCTKRKSVDLPSEAGAACGDWLRPAKKKSLSFSGKAPLAGVPGLARNQTWFTCRNEHSPSCRANQ